MVTRDGTWLPGVAHGCQGEYIVIISIFITGIILMILRDNKIQGKVHAVRTLNSRNSRIFLDKQKITFIPELLMKSAKITGSFIVT